MKVLVQELKCPGHFLPYALEVANAHAEGGNEVVLALNGELRPRLKLLLGDAGPHDSMRVHWVDGIKTDCSSMHTARLEVDTCHQLIKKYRVGRVVLPSADSVAVRLIPDVRRARLLGANGVPWDLIVHSGWATPSVFGRRVDKRIMHHFAFRMTARPNVRLLAPDPYIALGPARRLLSRRVDRCCSYIPHPFLESPNISREEARAELQLPTEGRLLVVPGTIDMRKAMDRLLGAFPSLSGTIDGLLMAGVVGPECQRLIDQVKDSGGPKLHIIDQFLDSRSFYCAVLAADVVWAVSPRWRGISSIQFLAVQWRSPLYGRPDSSICGLDREQWDWVFDSRRVGARDCSGGDRGPGTRCVIQESY